MDKSKEQHPEALEESVDAGLNLFRREILGLFDGAETDEEREERVLPKSEKYDGFDGEELEDGLVGVDQLAYGYVELNQTVHCHGDGDTDEQSAPDMGKPRHPTVETVISKVLGGHGDESTKGTNDGVLKNADLHEPQEVQSFRSVLARTEGPDPEAMLDFDVAKDCVLLRSGISGIGEDEVEEGGDQDGLVAVSDGLIVQRFMVEEVRHEGDDGVDGHHDEKADDMTLLLGTGVVGEMFPYEPYRGDGGDKSHDTADEPADMVCLEIDVAVLEEGLGIGGLVRNDGACHVNHVGRRLCGATAYSFGAAAAVMITREV